MKPFANVFFFAFFGLATLVMGCASSPTVDGPRNCVMSSEVSDPNRVSAGTQGDTLKACLARIPCDASEGQLRIATLTCERDQKARASIKVVPGQ
jgi:hypothetical protein